MTSRGGIIDHSLPIKPGNVKRSLYF